MKLFAPVHMQESLGTGCRVPDGVSARCSSSLTMVVKTASSFRFIPQIVAPASDQRNSQSFFSTIFGIFIPGFYGMTGGELDHIQCCREHEQYQNHPQRQ